MMIFVFACDKVSKKDDNKPPEIVTMKIKQPPPKPKPVEKKKAPTPKQNQKTEIKKTKPKVGIKASVAVEDSTGVTAEHYDAKGKLDPFKSLIQKEPVVAKAESKKKKGPPRILTPLEKLTLSQIRLVAVIEMEDRRIAMVEVASGKGYQVSVGTFIGKNGGKITQIKKNSIVVKEPVRDFRGKISEREQEIKLNK